MGRKLCSRLDPRFLNFRLLEDGGPSTGGLQLFGWFLWPARLPQPCQPMSLDTAGSRGHSAAIGREQAAWRT